MLSVNTTFILLYKRVELVVPSSPLGESMLVTSIFIRLSTAHRPSHYLHAPPLPALRVMEATTPKRNKVFSQQVAQAQHPAVKIMAAEEQPT